MRLISESCSVVFSPLASKPPGKRYVTHKKQALEPYVHEFEQTPGDGERRGSLVCCSP